MRDSFYSEAGGIIARLQIVLPWFTRPEIICTDLRNLKMICVIGSPICWAACSYIGNWKDRPRKFTASALLLPN